MLFLFSNIVWCNNNIQVKLGFQVFEETNVIYKKYGTFDPLSILPLLGIPKKINRWESPDNRDPTVDWRNEEWVWDGAKVVLLKAISISKKKVLDHSLWVESIEVSNPKIKLYGGVAIGMSKNAFLKKLNLKETELRSTGIDYTFAVHYEYRVKNSDFIGHVLISIILDEKENIRLIKWNYFGD